MLVAKVEYNRQALLPGLGTMLRITRNSSQEQKEEPLKVMQKEGISYAMGKRESSTFLDITGT